MAESGRKISALDDPRIPPGIEIPASKSGRISYRSWHLPLNYDNLTLREGFDFLSIVSASQYQIPEIIRWTEGKDSHLVRQFFYGGVDLLAHDCIHLLLGRGLLTKDEAFVIGYTMGSTQRLETLNKEIFAYIAGHYYPNAYRMDSESQRVFLDATHLGQLSQCRPLDEVDFGPFMDCPLQDLRYRLAVPVKFLNAYYQSIERIRYPMDPASIRSSTPDPGGQTWIFPKENSQSTVSELAQNAENSLNQSDFPNRQSLESIRHICEGALLKHQSNLQIQHEIAEQCFQEIFKICGPEHPVVQQDIELEPWIGFFQKCATNLKQVSDQLMCPDHRNHWELAGPGLEARSYVHALLNRGNSPVDRAFCRGFYDGSSDDKSSYATQLKLDFLSRIGSTLDGPYSDSMKSAYQDGVHLAFVSDCHPMQSIRFDSIAGLPISMARRQLNLAVPILIEYQNLSPQ